MDNPRDLAQWVLEAQGSSYAADALIEQYMPFIKSETVKFTKRDLSQEEDALSIAMLAFYECIMAYRSGRGAFLRLAATAIRNRLVDHYRQEQRHKGLISYDAQEEDRDGTMLDRIADQKDHPQTMALREAAREEITEFSGQLTDFGLSLADVADNCPRQSRTMAACMEVLAYAKGQPLLLQQLLRSKKLPIHALSEATGVDKKTLERHRKYLVAVLLAFTNGFEIIRGHLYQMQQKEVRRP